MVNLNNLIDKYPYLFPNQFPKSIWINKKNDSIRTRALFKKSSQVCHLKTLISIPKKLHLIFEQC